MALFRPSPSPEIEAAAARNTIFKKCLKSDGKEIEKKDVGLLDKLVFGVGAEDVHLIPLGLARVGFESTKSACNFATASSFALASTSTVSGQPSHVFGKSPASM